jgi:serine/threonine protein phosphatase 1
MSITYAIPDLHGRLDLLEAAFGQIASHAAGRASTIVTLGDYIDRGPNSAQVIDRLMGWQSDTLRLVVLKGNHEMMMWEVCNHLAELDWWIENGGDQTLRSYGIEPEQTGSVGLVPAAHLDWIKGLGVLHVDQHRVYVHAGVDVAVALERQSEQVSLWKRYPAGSGEGYGSRHVVHGHHAHIHGPIVGRSRTNLDAMAWKTGRLVIGVFLDDAPGGAQEFLEVRCPPVMV